METETRHRLTSLNPQNFLQLLYRHSGQFDNTIVGIAQTHFALQYNNLLANGFLTDFNLNKLDLSANYMQTALPPILLNLFDRGYFEGASVIDLPTLLGVSYVTIKRASHNIYSRNSILRSRRIAEGMNLSTRSKIARINASSVGIDRKTELVRDLMVGVGAINRGVSLARTETIYNLNTGSKRAWKDSRVINAVQWVVANDDRLCQFCITFNGRILAIDDDFAKEGENIAGTRGGTLPTLNDVPVPPLHPRCRCTLVPV